MTRLVILEPKNIRTRAQRRAILAGGRLISVERAQAQTITAPTGVNRTRKVIIWKVEGD